MSLSPFRHPLDIAKHPTFEPEVKRAILASWASDATAAKGRPAIRLPGRARRAAPIDGGTTALKPLDH